MQGYICVGGTATAQSGTARGGGGVDLIWDLWNEQFSAFYYVEAAAGLPQYAVGANVYTGFGFGMCDDVHDAWSGTFLSAEVGFEISAWRFAQLSANVQAFRNPSGSFVGGLVGAGASLSLPASVTGLMRLPLGLSAAASVGEWYAYDQLTRRLHSSRISGARVRRGSGGMLIDLSPGMFGVASHLEHVLGLTNPLLPTYALYAIGVSFVKSYMAANNLGTNREQGIDELHRWACSKPYRLIRQYIDAHPSGSSQMSFDDGWTVQRTPRGRFLLTSSVGGGGAVGAWATVMRLHEADGSAAATPAVTYRVALRGARNGFINGRSYSMMRFSDEIMRHRNRMMRF